MIIKESTRKLILIAVIIIIAIGLLVAKVMAKKQDEQFANNEALYSQVIQLYSQQQFAEAAPLAEELLKKQPNAEIVNYISGMIAAGNEEFVAAAVHLQKTLDINPYKVEDAIFMLQFAEVLVHAENYEAAQKVLEKCQQAEWAPEDYPTYQEHVQELLADIEEKQGGK
ncbi:tetratricopeptide repeat protein [Metasolibacillus sp. FSL K6-0083]|uniref:tetratricopeptide repeat protein n=1 Tax=Metasolibacillus sp. FSL K6-0083 TaxID=2921416 RepID=UPI003159AE7E